MASIPSLLSALADNTVDVIVVANGTYHISHSGNQASDSLWIGSRYAGRTRPVTVRAATIGQVTFDGGGGALGGISFNGGAHDQTWDGFHFANGVVGSTGVIVFGGYAGMAAPYDISLKHITVDASIHRINSGATDHAMYFSYALDGWHDILIEDFTVAPPTRWVSHRDPHGPRLHNGLSERRGARRHGPTPDLHRQQGDRIPAGDHAVVPADP